MNWLKFSPNRLDYISTVEASVVCLSSTNQRPIQSITNLQLLFHYLFTSLFMSNALSLIYCFMAFIGSSVLSRSVDLSTIMTLENVTKVIVLPAILVNC